ncbi:hypothetical protein [Sphingomonas sp.]|uniref:hypothetical protein n=1 Tax=Sphingomonas sp. TaxID=28214 RepID=UPI001B2E877D|nr:hypothetical protein [Sphingomonas sp.]MBO9714917.1 hypothetical protein [Sphingomonas sp.]
MPLLLAWMLSQQAAPWPQDTVTDAQIVALAARYEKGKPDTYVRDFGIHHGTRVVGEYRCSDLCPRYTTRVIHYDVAPGPQCAAIGGVERVAMIPVAIAARQETYCVPAVLGTEPIDLGGS